MSKRQIILAVDDNGKFLEYIPKEVGHKGEGRRHLAIAVLLQNSKGEVLLQKRKHKIFDNIWDITGATHPLHEPHPCHSEESRIRRDKLRDVGIYIKQDCHALRARNDKKCKICNKDNVDETLEDATKRCLREEFGIESVRELRDLGEFNYFAKYNGDCEFEHCHLLIGEYDGEVKANPEMVYEYKWVAKQEFLKDIKENPQNYSPWATEALRLLRESLQ